MSGREDQPAFGALWSNSLRNPKAAKAAVHSQMMTAPVPKAIRPIAAFVAASPDMKVPLNCRSPGPNAIQLLIAPKQAKMHRPIRILLCAQPERCACRQVAAVIGVAEQLDDDGDAGEEEGQPQSSSQSGPCRLEGPPGIGSSPAPTAKKNAPAIIATVAAKYLLAGVAGVGSPIGQPRI